MARKSSRSPRTGARDPAVGRFIEQFALLMTASGVPRMPGRVFVALLTSPEGRMTAGELADGLQVSRAAVSGAVKYLVQYGLARRVREPGDKLDSYRVDGETWFESFARRDALLVQWEACLRTGVDAVGRDTDAGVRLDETRRFFAFLRGELPRMMQKWARKRRTRIA